MLKEKTMSDIYNEMTPEQQLCVAFYVSKAVGEENNKNKGFEPNKKPDPWKE